MENGAEQAWALSTVVFVQIFAQCGGTRAANGLVTAGSLYP